jgi:hypothetical protein
MENVHSILGARTNATDNAAWPNKPKGKGDYACKHEMQSFKNPCLYHPKSSITIDKLKIKVAVFLIQRSLECCTAILARLYYCQGFEVRARRWQSGHCQTGLETRLCLIEFCHWDSHQSKDLLTHKCKSSTD